MLLSTTCPLPTPGALIPPSVSCWYARNVVVAPTEMTLGSSDGAPIVDEMPASPELTTTVTPAATAASFASFTVSSESSGNGLPPKDSLRTFTPWATA